MSIENNVKNCIWDNNFFKQFVLILDYNNLNSKDNDRLLKSHNDGDRQSGD